jgi:septal ring factor EnvC (AmiA/AmiB activator)
VNPESFTFIHRDHKFHVLAQLFKPTDLGDGRGRDNMTLFSTNLKLPSPVRRPKVAPTSDVPELRQQLRAAAERLQGLAITEAAVLPRIERLTREKSKLEETCSEHEATIKEMENDIAKAAAPQDDPEASRQEKVDKIAELEERYQRLLAQKAAFLARADDGDFG